MKNPLSQVLTLLCAVSVLGLTGCDIDSGDETVRSIGVDLSGFYQNGGGRIVNPSNTGAAINSLNLVQTGDRLEAVDNNGQIFRGTVGSVVDTQASFNMTGSTTAGNEAVIAGTFAVNGTTATMNGTWAEPALFGSVSAVATVGGLIEGDSGTGDDGTGGGTTGNALSISASGGSATADLAVNATRTFTASGGAGTYSWSVSSSTDGTLSSSTGRTVTYTARNGGSQTVTVSDGSTTETVSFTQN